MPSVADMVSAMYMRCIHAGVRSRLGEPNLLAWYQIYGNADAYLRDVYAMTGWAWQNSCGVGCANGSLVSLLSTPCLFLSHLLPSHLLTFYHVGECAS